MAFYGYCGPTSILYILKQTVRELRASLQKNGKGEKGNKGKKGNGSARHASQLAGVAGRGNGGSKGSLTKRETYKELAKKNKIYALLLYLPTVNYLGDKLNTSEKLGTQPEDMVRLLKRLGYKVRVREEATWAELKKAVDDDQKQVLVDWWTDIGDPGEDLGHYSVVTRISSKTLTIYDPDINKKRVLGKNTFLERWHDVRADGRKMLSWMCEIKHT